MVEPLLRVLFVCTANSARSQIAEAILRHLSHGRIDVHSAGSLAAGEIHPLAQIAVRNVLRSEMSGQRPKTWDTFLDQHFDFVITVCDRAAESCPVFPGEPERIHWSCPDPALATGTVAERQRAFDDVARQLVGRMRIWLALPRLRSAIEAAVD